MEGKTVFIATSQGISNFPPVVLYFGKIYIKMTYVILL